MGQRCGAWVTSSVQQPSESGADDQDRVVSRRVNHPTNADPQDEATYEAANPAPDGDLPTPPEPAPAAPDEDAGEAGGASEKAAAELDDADESEPTRSE
jgi:hypothetical protein